MASEERKAADSKIREDNLFASLGAGEQQAETDAFQCGRCKQRKCRYRQAQTRSADEPMTVSFLCFSISTSSTHFALQTFVTSVSFCSSAAYNANIFTLHRCTVCNNRYVHSVQIKPPSLIPTQMEVLLNQFSTVCLHPPSLKYTIALKHSFTLYIRRDLSHRAFPSSPQPNESTCIYPPSHLF